jgi:cytochrome d ubiquinol oxidase subunit II
MDLALIWAGIIAFGVFAYVVMDGFDLGIGILFSRFESGAERSQAMNSIAPYWDGNETWLVLGGGGLLAAFPVAYAVLLPATYPLIIAMLLGLIFRGVAFEFRWRDKQHEALWDRAFMIGSLVAALAQGIILGALLQGIKVANDAYAGGILDWLTPFTMLTGIGVVLGYALLGATWLIWRTEGTLQSKARKLAFGLTFLVLGIIALVSVATLFLQQSYWTRWLSFPRILFCAPVPVLTALAGYRLITGIDRTADHVPFLMALAIFFMGFAGLGISLYPDIIPPSITIHQAAAPPASLSFLLAGTVFIIPLILVYTGWAYWVFRGKVGSTGGYH